MTPTDRPPRGDIVPLDLSRVRTHRLADRPRKVSAAAAARPWTPGGAFAAFLEGLPAGGAAADLQAVIAAVADARRRGRPVLLGMGAHVIKVGLSPIVIDLMERGIVSGVALNGAGIIHDAELAMAGRTSEDVAPALRDGAFGMAAETPAVIAAALRSAAPGTGLGRAVGDRLLAERGPFVHQSLLAAGARLDVPVTVHVAIGTDILHMHPVFDAARTGEASHIDFRLFAAQVARLEGGVYINAGSAVILPEVFLKAVALARNLGHRLDAVTTVDMDAVRHYRPTVNVVERPTARGGRGIQLVGQHEILLPLVAAGVKEALRKA